MDFNFSSSNVLIQLLGLWFLAVLLECIHSGIGFTMSGAFSTRYKNYLVLLIFEWVDERTSWERKQRNCFLILQK